jgi:hypothetical protein
MIKFPNLLLKFKVIYKFKDYKYVGLEIQHNYIRHLCNVL